MTRTSFPLYLMLPLLWRFIRKDTPEFCPFEVERDIKEKRLIRDGETDIILTVRNRGKKAARIRIVEQLPAGLALTEGDTNLFTKLKAGESAAMKYRIRSGRGRHRFAAVRITVWNAMGLEKSEYEIEKESEIITMATTGHLSSLPINVRKTLVFAGLNPSGQGGDGVYFHDVREYRPGDPLRHIHWNGVAKNPDKLITREFEQERVSDIGIILDARNDAYYQYGINTYIEETIDAAAALSGILLSLQNRVGLMIYGRFLDWTMPGYGKMQQERIRRALSSVTTGNHHVFKTLKNLPTNLFPERSQLIFISPLLDSDLEFLKRLRGRGYAIIVISPDCLSRTTDSYDPLTREIASIQRNMLLKDLERSGITVLNWNMKHSMEKLIQLNKGRLRMAVRGKL